MAAQLKAVQTFPSVRLPSHAGGLPVEVALIAQLGVGAGDELIQGVLARQQAHEDYIDALDEPSARIGAMDLDRGDATSLYTFSVGRGGHPFHRHAGHRVFTAVSGSTGAQLRFSTASSAQTDADPQAFVEALRQVAIPPDALFTVRFGGGTWHQFVPLQRGSRSPALFALSCHTDELGGALSPALRALVESNAAGIPALTEVLPPPLRDALQAMDPARVPTIALSLHAAPVSLAARLCATTRRIVGPWRGRIGRLWPSGGFLAAQSVERTAFACVPDPDSMLTAELADGFQHEDCVSVRIPAADLGNAPAATLLASVLEGFLENRSAGVSGLMSFRNVLVRPLRLRTSPLGCPVSSLLSPGAGLTFAGRFPVRSQCVDPLGRHAEVVLGADDRHLRFRSSVRVAIAPEGGATVSLATRVQTRNAFGRLYMGAIDRVHRRYIAPTMLRLAVEYALGGAVTRSSRV